MTAEPPAAASSNVSPAGTRPRAANAPEGADDIRRFYTAAMLAELIGVPADTVRRWHRRRLISAVCEVKHVAYFDFPEVAAARRLAELAAAGVKPRAIERQLRAISQRMPDVARPLLELPVVVHGNRLLLREGDALVEPHGQRCFDFDSPVEEDAAAALALQSQFPAAAGPPATLLVPTTAEQMLRFAVELEEDHQLAAAAEMYRAAMAAQGPTAETCFQLADLLYRMGDATAARERYYMAVELDEDFVEARANLGCVLLELGHAELAVAAFEGALRSHADYADAHYHLARTLDELGQPDRAVEHWRWFLSLSPESPWADEAERRLESAPQPLF